MKRVVFGVVGFIVLALVAMLTYFVLQVEPSETFDPNSLEGMAQNMVQRCGTLQLVDDFEIVERRETPDGTLLLFRASCFSFPDWTPVYGYQLGDLIGPGRMDGEAGWGQAAVVPPGQPIEYNYSSSITNGVHRTILTGRVLDPEVAVVEATFGDDEIVRSEVGSELFALIHHGRGELRGMRVFDGDGQLLWEE